MNNTPTGGDTRPGGGTPTPPPAPPDARDADHPRLPYFKFYSRDWQADTGLRSCSLAARALWLEVLCLMHTSPRRGELLAPDGAMPMPIPALARLIGADRGEVERLLTELRANRVVNEIDGVIVSRKMLRDDAKLRACVTSGHKGGNPGLRKTRGLTPGLTPPLTPRLTQRPTLGLGVGLTLRVQRPETITQTPPNPRRGE